MMSAAGSALVAGSIAPSTMGKTQHIKVVRSFLHQGKAVAVGSVVEVPVAVARELVAMNKAITCEPEAKPAPRAAKVEPPKEAKNDLQR